MRLTGVATTRAFSTSVRARPCSDQRHPQSRTIPVSAKIAQPRPRNLGFFAPISPPTSPSSHGVAKARKNSAHRSRFGNEDKIARVRRPRARMKEGRKPELFVQSSSRWLNAAMSAVEATTSPANRAPEEARRFGRKNSPPDHRAPSSRVFSGERVENLPEPIDSAARPPRRRRPPAPARRETSMRDAAMGASENFDRPGQFPEHIQVGGFGSQHGGQRWRRPSCGSTPRGQCRLRSKSG